MRDGVWMVRVRPLAPVLNKIWDEDGYSPKDLAEKLLELACELKKARREFHMSMLTAALQPSVVEEAQAAYLTALAECALKGVPKK